MALVPEPSAGGPVPIPGTRWAARQTLTVGAAAVPLSPPGNVVEALVQVLANPVRMTMDGAAPAAASGVGWNADDWFRVTGLGDIRTLRFIREGAADGTLEVNYFVESD